MQEYKFNYFHYKKKIHKANKISISLIFVSIIILLSCVTILKPTSTKEINFYFIEVGNFNTYKEANKLASNLQTQNAAGYIYFDKTYHVIANYYLTIEDAQKVCNNIKETYSNAKVYTLTTTYNKKTNKIKEESKLITSITNSLFDFINTLTQISVSIDKNEISTNQAQIKINDINNLFNTSLNDLKNNTNNKTFEIYNKNLKNIKNSLKNLTNSTNLEQNFKFYLVDIVINFSSFLDYSS